MKREKIEKLKLKFIAYSLENNNMGSIIFFLGNENCI